MSSEIKKLMKTAAAMYDKTGDVHPICELWGRLRDSPFLQGYLRERLNSAGPRPPHVPAEEWVRMATDDVTTFTFVAAAWAQLGFNVFCLDDSDCARFATMAADSLDDVRLPYPSSLLLLPPGWGVSQHVFAWGFENPDVGKYRLGYMIPKKGLYGQTWAGEGWGDAWHSVETADGDDRRQASMAQAIVSGFAAWLSTGRADTKMVARSTRKRRRDDSRLRPTKWILTSSTLELQGGLIARTKAAVASGGRAAAHTMQHVVRGHRKRQRYGPKSALCRWIWVEPYWRGPDSETAPAHLYN